MRLLLLKTNMMRMLLYLLLLKLRMHLVHLRLHEARVGMLLLNWRHLHLGDISYYLVLFTLLSYIETYDRIVQEERDNIKEREGEEKERNRKR
jgi:hypothetical protein